MNEQKERFIDYHKYVVGFSEPDDFEPPRVRFCMYEDCEQMACWDWEGQKYCKYHVHLATNFEFYTKLIDWHKYVKKDKKKKVKKVKKKLV